MGTAWFNDDPDIRTEFKNLNIITPHIEAAYFAKKVVTRQENDELSVSFERIAHTFLGRDVYVIIKLANTSQVRNETFKLSLLTGNTTLTGTADQVLTLGETNQSNGSKYHTRLSNDPEVLRNPNQPVVQINNPVYNNLDDFSDTLIYKIPLRPRTRATFNTWATNIYQNLSLVNLYFRLESDAYMLRKQVPFLSSTFFASKSLTFEPTMDTSRLWSNTFTLRNGIVYEIYHPDNMFNPLGTHTYLGHQVNKRIGKIDNARATQATYIFHNLIDNEYEICECNLSNVRQRGNGQQVSSALFHSTYSNYINSENAPIGGDAETNYHYEDGAIISYGTAYGYRRYPLLNPNDENDLIPLIRMPDSLDIDEEQGNSRVRATFIYRNTARRFCNPDCFAGFIGVLIQLEREDVVCTGMCFADATSYPSVTHPNGDSVDTAYLANLQREQLKVNSFNDNYFENIYKGRGWKMANGVRVTTIAWLPQLTRATAINGHEDHLHAGEFNTEYVHNIN